MAEKKRLRWSSLPATDRPEKAKSHESWIGKTQLRLLDGQSVTVKIVEKSRKKRVYQPCYDATVAALLELLWKTFNWPCGKLFAPFLRQNLDLIRLRETYRMSDTAAAKLKKISPGAIDRLQRTIKQRMKLRGPPEPHRSASSTAPSPS